MDYRYETKEEIMDFHKKRIAFIIINNELHFIKNGGLSHWEYCANMNITKEEFNKLIRGYYINNNVVFYKDNFIYDEDVINTSLKYLSKIKKECNVIRMNIYFGCKVDTNLLVWPYDYYYGIINEKDEIIKNNFNRKH